MAATWGGLRGGGVSEGAGGHGGGGHDGGGHEASVGYGSATWGSSERRAEPAGASSASASHLYDQAAPLARAKRPLSMRPALALNSLVPFTTYGVVVTAESRAGAAPPSLEVELETAGTVPTTPGIPFMVASTDATITVLWIPPEFTNGSDVDCYEVRRYPAHDPEPWEVEEDAIAVAKANREAHLRPGARANKMKPKFGPPTASNPYHHKGESVRYRCGGEDNFVTCTFKTIFPSAVSSTKSCKLWVHAGKEAGRRRHLGSGPSSALVCSPNYSLT